MTSQTESTLWLEKLWMKTIRLCHDPKNVVREDLDTKIVIDNIKRSARFMWIKSDTIEYNYLGCNSADPFFSYIEYIMPDERPVLEYRDTKGVVVNSWIIPPRDIVLFKLRFG